MSIEEPTNTVFEKIASGERPAMPYVSPELIRELAQSLGLATDESSVLSDVESVKRLSIESLGKALVASFSRLEESLEHLRVELLSHPDDELLVLKQMALENIRCQATNHTVPGIFDPLTHSWDEAFLGILLDKKIMTYENTRILRNEIFSVFERQQQQMIIETTEESVTTFDFIKGLAYSASEDDFVEWFQATVQQSEFCPDEYKTKSKEDIERFFRKDVITRTMVFLSHVQEKYQLRMVLNWKDLSQLVKTALVDMTASIDLLEDDDPRLFLQEMIEKILQINQVFFDEFLESSDIIPALEADRNECEKEDDMNSSGEGMPVTDTDKPFGYSSPDQDWGLGLSDLDLGDYDL